LRQKSEIWPFETILIPILLEQEKALAELGMKIRGYEEKEASFCRPAD